MSCLCSSLCPRFIALMSLVGVLQFGGCTGESTTAGPVVTGSVSVDGEPVMGGTVLFIPQGSKRSGGSGIIDENGDFTVRTSAVENGLVPGTYNVVILAPDPVQVKEGDVPPPYPVPLKYQDEANPLLDATVTKNGPNEIEFELKGNEPIQSADDE
ncbi:MAG: hypothetical protein R3C01_10030 [Planctomycetaceae bacterium]